MRATALVIVGTGALLVLIVVFITGGFVIDAGPLHLSARRPTGPLVITVAAFLLAALHGRTALADAGGAVFSRLDRHALALAAVLAAATAGVGVAYGTYAASGADAGGYVSQSSLIAAGRLVVSEPLARQVPWPDATWTFTPLGYRPGANAGELVPTYPSGLPLAMAAGRAVAGELGAFLAVPFLGALAVLCTYALGARLHSRIAGLTAAALLATSPIFLFQLVQPMSDVPAAAWWALTTLFALSPYPAARAALAAGATAGVAVLTRPNLVLLAIPVAMLTRRRAMAFAAGLIPAVAAVLALQWRFYGSPFVSGYGSLPELFSLANVHVNAHAYGRRLLTGEAPALTLVVLSVAAMVAARRRPADVEPGPSVRPALITAALVSLAVLASYLPYQTFVEWWYLRFLLPAFPVVFVLVGALATNAARVLPRSASGIVLAAAVVTACAVNITVAEREQAFNLQRYDSRYRIAGRYMASALPSNALVITVQHSASVPYYAALPILRWDILRGDLEPAIAALRALGRQPVLLVEDWEMADLRARFPGSTTARLDWTPRADFGSETRVRLWHPDDRGRPPPHPTDRLP